MKIMYGIRQAAQQSAAEHSQTMLQMTPLTLPMPKCRCLKSMIGESADMAGQAVPLSYLSLMWGLGTIMGPTIGGFLARPCSTYGSGFPLCAPGQLLAVRY